MTTFASIWLWIKKAGAWLWSHPAAIVAAVSAFIGAFLMYRSDKNKVASMKDALIVQKAKTDIAAATAQAELLEKQAGASEPRVQELKQQITESQRKVVEITEGPHTKGMSDEEVADLFGRSGL